MRWGYELVFLVGQGRVEIKMPEIESWKDEDDKQRVLFMKFRLFGDDLHALILGPTYSFYEESCTRKWCESQRIYFILSKNPILSDSCVPMGA